MINTLERPVVQSATTDLRAHHAQCEMNYHLCCALLPGLRQGRQHWSLNLGGAQSAQNVHIELLDSAPYTSTVLVTQSAPAVPHVKSAVLRVRLYHDVEMGEVVAWDRHRHWLPRYTYPNRQMYYPDEKLSLNRFLGEWLSHCREVGTVCYPVCEGYPINKK